MKKINYGSSLAALLHLAEVDGEGSPFDCADPFLVLNRGAWDEGPSHLACCLVPDNSCSFARDRRPGGPSSEQHVVLREPRGAYGGGARCVLRSGGRHDGRAMPVVR